MAIGIIGALEAIEGNARPDDNSVVPPIDRLASLPQAFIMQMAQKGQIPKSMVAPVLAKKAENAQLGMQMQAAMQKAQTGEAPPSTVIEKVIAQNAAQETAPVMDRSNVGVASAPMRPDMYRRGMVGGGIVAFSGEQGSFIGNLTDRIFGDSYAEQYGKNIAMSSEIKKRQENQFIKKMYEDKYGPDAGIYSEYNDALRELGLDPASPFGKGVLPRSIPDVNEEIERTGSLNIGVTGAGKGVFDEPPPPPADSVPIMEREAPNLSDDFKQRSRNEFNKDIAAAKEKTNEAKNTVKVSNDEVAEIIAGIEGGETLEKDSGEEKKSSIVDDIIKQTEEDRKPKSSSYDEFAEKASKLSGEELAMLGLEFGLNLLGTKEQNFLTAAGQAGKPALKTALARQAERRKAARESKMIDKKFSNQQALLKDEIDSREKIAGLDRKSRETIAATKLQEVVSRLSVSEANSIRGLISQAYLALPKDVTFITLSNAAANMEPGPERDEANRKVYQYVQDRLKGFMRATGTIAGRRDYEKEGFSGSQKSSN